MILQAAPHVWVPAGPELYRRWMPGGTPERLQGPQQRHGRRRCMSFAGGFGRRMQSAAAHSGAVFSPLDVSGAVFWLDLLDATSYTQAGTVTTFNNKVSAVAWNTAFNAFPAYSAAGFNGRPCMDLNGTNMGISSTEAAVFGTFTNTPPYTIFGAVQHDIADANHAWFSYGNSGTATASSGYWGTTLTGAGVWTCGLRSSGNNSFNVESTGACNILPNVQEWWHTGGVVSCSISGAAADPDAIVQDTSVVTPNRAGVGALVRPTFVAGTDGKIAEIILYAGVAHSAGNRTLVRQYMGTRWGITVA